MVNSGNRWTRRENPESAIRQVYSWIGAGGFTFGLGIALLTGAAGNAHADEGAATSGQPASTGKPIRGQAPSHRDSERNTSRSATPLNKAGQGQVRAAAAFEAPSLTLSSTQSLSTGEIASPTPASPALSAVQPTAARAVASTAVGSSVPVALTNRQRPVAAAAASSSPVPRPAVAVQPVAAVATVSIPGPPAPSAAAPRPVAPAAAQLPVAPLTANTLAYNLAQMPPDTIRVKAIKDTKGTVRLIVYMSGVADNATSLASGAFSNAGAAYTKTTTVVDQQIAKWKPAEVMWVGHSNGGQQGQIYASTHPIVTTLVTFGSPLIKKTSEFPANTHVLDIQADNDWVAQRFNHADAKDSYSGSSTTKVLLITAGNNSLPGFPAFDRHAPSAYPQYGQAFDSAARNTGSRFVTLRNDISRFAPASYVGDTGNLAAR